MAYPLSASEQLERAQLDATVISMVSEGYTFPQISTKIGKSLSQTYRIFQRGLRSAPVQAAEEYRRQHLERLELARKICLDELGASHWTVSHGHVVKLEVRRSDGSMSSVPLPDSGPKMQAIDRLLKIEQEEAKLLGMYPDARFSVETTVNYTVSGVDMGKLT